MAKKPVKKAKKTAVKPVKAAKKAAPSTDMGFLKKVKAEHGIALGAALILLKGVLGISVLIGVAILAASALKFAHNQLKK